MRTITYERVEFPLAVHNLHPGKCVLGLSELYLQQGQNARKSFKFIVLPQVHCAPNIRKSAEIKEKWTSFVSNVVLYQVQSALSPQFLY